MIEESTNFLGELSGEDEGKGRFLGQLRARGWETAGASLGPDRGVRGPKVRGRHSGVEAPPAA